MAKDVDISTKVTFDMKRIDQVLSAGIRDGMNALAITFVRNVSGSKGTLSRPGTGFHYPGNPTRSSRPGESPAAQTGRLRLSWMVTLPKPIKVFDGFVASLTQRGSGLGAASPVRYGWYLEKGTNDVAKRPYLADGKKPGAITLTQRTAQRVFEAEFSIGVEKANGIVK